MHFHSTIDICSSGHGRPAAWHADASDDRGRRLADFTLPLLLAASRRAMANGSENGRGHMQ
jgi:hypothetical protein